MKQLKCFFKGHDLDPDYNDYGHLICKRCEMHEYYDHDRIWYTIPSIPQLIKSKFTPVVKRCIDCNKVERIFGVYVGNHKECLPF